MKNEELADRLRAVTVTDIGVKMSVPSSVRSRDRLNEPVKEGHRSGVFRFLHMHVVLSVNGSPFKVNPNVADKRLRRRILRRAGGGSNLNALRSRPAKDAMAELLVRVRSACADEWQRVNVASFEKKASAILRTREQQDRMDEQKRAFERIKKELLGPLLGISETELVDLYRDCQVTAVMES